MFDPRQLGPSPGGPPPPAAPGPAMPTPPPGPPGGTQNAGPPPGLSPVGPQQPQDPAAMQGLAQAELLSRLEQLGDHDLAAIQHGISPQAVAVLARVVPELGVVLELIEEGVRAAQGDTGGDYAGDEGEGDYASDDDSEPDDTDAEGVDPEEPDADDEEEAPLRPARPKTALGRM